MLNPQCLLCLVSTFISLVDIISLGPEMSYSPTSTSREAKNLDLETQSKILHILFARVVRSTLPWLTVRCSEYMAIGYENATTLVLREQT